MKFEKGNAVTAFVTGNVPVLIHQVNCQGVMGGGIAREIRDRVPQHYADYEKALKTHYANKTQPLGNYVATTYNVSGANTTSILYGIFSQNNFGRDGREYTNYAAMSAALVAIAKNNAGKTLAVPYGIGCGLGGGDWAIVQTLLANVESMYDVEFVVVELV